MKDFCNTLYYNLPYLMLKIILAKRCDHNRPQLTINFSKSALVDQDKVVFQY